MCEQCRNHHSEEITSNHEVVLYHDRKRKLPSEKCRIHPTNDIDVYCDCCQDPVCSTCFASDHSLHDNRPLETVYNETLRQCQMELNTLLTNVIPKSVNNLKLLKEISENVRKEIFKSRLCTKKRADEMKAIVETLEADNNAKLEDAEKSAMSYVVQQENKIQDYIKYVNDLITDYESKVSSIKHTDLIKLHGEISSVTLRMPRIDSPVITEFTPGKLDQEEISKQFGEINKHLADKEKSQIPSLTEANSELTAGIMNREEIFQQFGHIKIISSDEETIQKYSLLPSSMKELKRITIPNLTTVCHLSLLPSGKFWASDRKGNLIQCDTEGNILQTLCTKESINIGYHTVTKEGELLYTERELKSVHRVTDDLTTTVLKTEDWIPRSIYSSHINGHILIGIRKEKDDWKVTRYNTTGERLHDIQTIDGGKIYKSINYITENVNGDICTSDSRANKVVVVTESGNYRFSYLGHESQSVFIPFGISTDALGHILVSNCGTMPSKTFYSIHMVDIDGQFLSLLLTPKQCPHSPSALCVSDQHNLWVGFNINSTVLVYEYLENTSSV
ncbi:uncharacterized protein LOC133180614 [Saccostrea echinata]|uniref:uncharacterized protein LOC133180614 n=1 Tax=Saccostrea echinata TaxID=191078 RepID=UPI002A82CFF6|nr:uncharacterized protein LOC133180614 [Saccostrea echinata]